MDFFQIVWENKFIFIFSFLAVFFTSFGVVYFSGLGPDELSSQTGLVSLLNADAAPLDTALFSTSTAGQAVETAAPTRITIAKIGVDATIFNPETHDSNSLDQLLTKGIVRYPGSGIPGRGNMFLFGHSTSLPIVHNPAYKSLNHLDSLVAGDEITIYTPTSKYIYTVTSVVKEDEHQAVVDIGSRDNKITISTCDTFSGVKQQRIVVEGNFTRVVHI